MSELGDKWTQGLKRAQAEAWAEVREQDFIDGLMAGFDLSAEGFNGEYVDSSFDALGDAFGQYLYQQAIADAVLDWRDAMDWADEVRG